MSKIYRVEYRPVRNTFSRNSKKGVIGDVVIEVKANDINEAMNIANGTIIFGKDEHEIACVTLMYRPCVECDEDGD